MSTQTQVGSETSQFTEERITCTSGKVLARDQSLGKMDKSGIPKPVGSPNILHQCYLKRLERRENKES